MPSGFYQCAVCAKFEHYVRDWFKVDGLDGSGTRAEGSLSSLWTTSHITGKQRPPYGMFCSVRCLKQMMAQGED